MKAPPAESDPQDARGGLTRIRSESARRSPEGHGLRPVAIASLLLLATGCLGSGEGHGPETAADRTVRSVLLISIDTLRADRLSAFGYGRESAPALTQLARRSAIFTSHRNNGGATLPSHMTMMTGLRPTVHGVGTGGYYELGRAIPTLAETLERAGFATAAFVDGGWMLGRFGFSRGFSIYDDEGGGLERTLPKASSWLSAHGAEPFFLFVHTYDVHSKAGDVPYSCAGGFEDRFIDESAPRFDGCRQGKCGTELLRWVNDRVRANELEARSVLSREDARFLSDRYDGCIGRADQLLGRFLAEQEVSGRLDSALVIVTSDHGEEFLEHGMFLHQQGGYEEHARIPLIVAFPDGRFEGRRVDAPTAMIDLMPTILEAVGVPPRGRMQGSSLLQTLRSGRPPRDEDVIGASYLRWPLKMLLNKRQLFSLDEDPHESVDLFEADPERTRSILAAGRDLRREDIRLRKRLRSVEGVPRELNLSPEEETRLRSLGYL